MNRIPQYQQQARLKVLVTTDLHAHVTNYDYYRDEVLTNVGLIGLADIIQSEREQCHNTLLLDNGDFLQGNPIGNYLRDYSFENTHPIIQIMNELDYDAGTLGNHEFDFGISFLEKMLGDLNHPVVNANIMKQNGQHWLTPYVILEREVITTDGQKIPLNIGIIGALPPQVLQWNHKIFADYGKEYSPLIVDDILQSIEKNIPLMRLDGADMIIVLAHSGFANRPYEKGAENVIQFLAKMDGIDAIVAGHAHNIFPDDVHHLDNAPPIVMAGSFGQYLGIIDFDLAYKEQQWCVQHAKVELRANENFHQLMHPLFASIQTAHELTIQRMNMPIGQNNTIFSSSLSLIQDDCCIQVVADAQLWFAEKLLHDLDIVNPNIPLLSAVPVFKAGGRKNAPYDFTWIDQGILTFKNVADIYPFNNQLALVKLTGKELKEWLECANSIYYQIHNEADERQYLINWKSHRSYNRDVIKGVSYQVDPRYPRRYNGDCMLINPQSERIHGLTYLGRPIKHSDEFILATNQYRAYSGKFPGSGEDKVIALSTEEIPEILAQYLIRLVEDHKEIKITPDYNWRLSTGENHKSTTIIYETSPDVNVHNYIENIANALEPLNEVDEQGFYLYRMR